MGDKFLATAIRAELDMLETQKNTLLKEMAGMRKEHIKLVLHHLSHTRRED